MNTFNKSNVKRYMRSIVEEHWEESMYSYNLTTLAESAAHHFSEDYDNDPLDDETHWIWEASCEVADEAKKFQNR